MRRTRGFLLAGPMLYAAIGASVIIVGLTIALKIQSSRLETCKEEFTVFRTETKRIGEAQEKANREKELEDKKLKEKTDADHKSTIARLNRDIKRLRDVHARSSLTPEARPAAKRPDLACFDRAELARAVGGLEEGVLRLTRQGDEARLDLDTAREWARK